MDIYAKRLYAWAIFAVGTMLLLAAAWVAVARPEIESRPPLLIVGGLLVIAPLIAHRLKTVKHAGFSVEFEVIEFNAPKTATILGQTSLPELVEHYQFIHQHLNEKRHAPAKVYLQDMLVDKASAVAASHSLDSKEVRRLFRSGTPAIKVLALGLMRGDPSLVDAPTLERAISDSKSGNEQYHALRLAEEIWPRLAEDDRANLRNIIEADEYIPKDPDRAMVAAGILAWTPVPKGMG